MHRSVVGASRRFVVLRLLALVTAATLLGAMLSAVLCCSAARASSDRVALVFGNGRYANVAQLPNAGNDARMMATALRDIGFTVIEGFDLPREAMESKIRDFLRTSEDARVRVFYYAGHGVQVDGRNYLIPVSAKLDWAGALNFETVALDSLLGALDSTSHANVVILDACRNNPFAKTLAKGGATGRGVALAQSGLAGYANVGAGTLVAYSTAPDKVALDGAGTNSPFTAALARHVRTKGLEVRQMLTRVRADVAAQTSGAQIPWDNSALLGDVYLAGTGDGTPPPPPTPPAMAADEIMWGAIRDSSVAAVFDEFANKFPASPHVREARGRSDELKAKNPTTVAMLPPGAGKVPDELANAPANLPIAQFTRTNGYWQVTLSFPDAVQALAWRTDESATFRETGFMDTFDQRTHKRFPNMWFQLAEDQKPTTIWVRYVDVNGTTREPVPIRFDPSVELRRSQRKILEMITGNWLTLQGNSKDMMLHYTMLVTYRCAIRQVRIGINSTVPDRALALPPCNESNPLTIPHDAPNYLTLPLTTTMVSVELTYQDGTVSEIKTFRAKTN